MATKTKHIKHRTPLQRIKDLEERFERHLDYCQKNSGIESAIRSVARAVRESKGDMTAEQEQAFMKKVLAGLKANTTGIADAQEDPPLQE